MPRPRRRRDRFDAAAKPAIRPRLARRELGHAPQVQPAEPRVVARREIPRAVVVRGAREELEDFAEGDERRVGAEHERHVVEGVPPRVARDRIEGEGCRHGGTCRVAAAFDVEAAGRGDVAAGVELRGAAAASTSLARPRSERENATRGSGRQPLTPAPSAGSAIVAADRSRHAAKVDSYAARSRTSGGADVARTSSPLTPGMPW